MHYIFFVFSFFAGIYTIWDYLRRGRSHISSLLWGIGVALMFFVFFPLHLKTRPKLNINSSIDITNEIEVACPKCKCYYKANSNYCPNCGCNVKKDD